MTPAPTGNTATVAADSYLTLHYRLADLDGTQLGRVAGRGLAARRGVLWAGGDATVEDGVDRAPVLQLGQAACPDIPGDVARHVLGRNAKVAAAHPVRHMVRRMVAGDKPASGPMFSVDLEGHAVLSGAHPSLTVVLRARPAMSN